MSEAELKEYVVLARLTDDRDIKSLVHAINLQEATRKAVKLLTPRMNYRKVAIVEVEAGVTEGA